MRISVDLDDLLICYGSDVECEPRLPWWVGKVIRDEPLRKGSRRLAAQLHELGHSLWVYTSPGRTVRWIRWWLRFHGIRVDGIVNGKKHARCFGEGSLPSKRPHVFGISLHIGNSRGVTIEGNQYGFSVCVIDPTDTDWTEHILASVKQHGCR